MYSWSNFDRHNICPEPIAEQIACIVHRLSKRCHKHKRWKGHCITSAMSHRTNIDRHGVFPQAARSVFKDAGKAHCTTSTKCSRANIDRYSICPQATITSLGAAPAEDSCVRNHQQAAEGIDDLLEIRYEDQSYITANPSTFSLCLAFLPPISSSNFSALIVCNTASSGHRLPYATTFSGAEVHSVDGDRFAGK